MVRHVAWIAISLVCGALGCTESRGPAARPTPNASRAASATSSPSTAAPSASVHALPAAAPGEEIGVYFGISVSDARAVAARQIWRMQPCRALARAAVPPQTGWIEMNIVIEESGEIASVVRSASAGLGDDVLACVLDGLKKAKFSPPEAGIARGTAWVSLR